MMSPQNLVLTFASVVGATAAPICPPANFSTVSNFDLNAYIQRTWYIHQQMEVSYLPASQNRCVRADYSLKDKQSVLGYDVDVLNHAEDVAPPHTVHDGSICAKIVDQMAGKFEVAPCFLPSLFAGPYWVIDYNEEEGYALVSGGAPTKSAEGGCQTGSGVNGSGLWIFTREVVRDEALIQKVRGIAANKGFDLSVLNDVDQTPCNPEAVVV